MLFGGRVSLIPERDFHGAVPWWHAPPRPRPPPQPPNSLPCITCCHCHYEWGTCEKLPMGLSGSGWRKESSISYAGGHLFYYILKTNKHPPLPPSNKLSLQIKTVGAHWKIIISKSFHLQKCRCNLEKAPFIGMHEKCTPQSSIKLKLDPFSFFLEIFRVS